MAKKVMILSILLLVLLGLFLYYVFKKSDKKPKPTPETFYETAPRIEGYGDWEYENEESAYVPH